MSHSCKFIADFRNEACLILYSVENYSKGNLWERNILKLKWE